MQKVSAALIPFLLVLAMESTPAAAQKDLSAPAAAELTQLLKQFLAAASTNDKAMFDRFFADDAIYTRSAGVTITKADIMKSLNAPAAGTPEAQAAAQRSGATYDADDITVHQYGDTAIVNFRLIAKPADGGASSYYRNTGTFLKRNGQWQVIAWQSTKAAEASAQSAK
jgi:ketosteroid isomerase-like protein